jgi:hypothetical protein
VHGWVARRFDSDERAGAAYRKPGAETISEQHPDGWWWVAERWRSLASRNLYLLCYANHAERAEHDLLPPAARRAWLLKLVAIKDAVRGWLWARGAGPIHPAELHVHPESGRVTGQHGLVVPELDIAVAQHAEVAVASVTHSTIAIRDWTPGRDGDGSVIANPPGLPAHTYLVHAK